MLIVSLVIAGTVAAVYGSLRDRRHLPPELEFLNEYQATVSRSEAVRISGSTSTHFANTFFCFRGDLNATIARFEQHLSKDPQWTTERPTSLGQGPIYRRYRRGSPGESQQSRLEFQASVTGYGDLVYVSFIDFSRPMNSLEVWINRHLRQ